MGAAPPLLDQIEHLIAARAAWARAPVGSAATPRQLTIALALIVELAPLPAGVPFLLSGSTVFCSSTKGGQACGLRTLAAVAFVVLRAAGAAFSAADVWLVAHQLATHGAAWSKPPSLLTPQE